MHSCLFWLPWLTGKVNDRCVFLWHLILRRDRILCVSSFAKDPSRSVEDRYQHQNRLQAASIHISFPTYFEFHLISRDGSLRKFLGRCTNETTDLLTRRRVVLRCIAVLFAHSRKRQNLLEDELWIRMDVSTDRCFYINQCINHRATTSDV